MALTTSTYPRVIYSYTHLLGPGSTRELVSNGSLVSPVDFTYSPAQDELLFGIAIYMRDGGTMDYTDFGSNLGLTNGMLFQVKTLGTYYDLCNITTNEELFYIMGSSSAGGSSSLLGLGGTSGFLNDSDNVVGILSFVNNPITLKQADADTVRIRVRDNLTGIDRIRAVAITMRYI